VSYTHGDIVRAARLSELEEETERQHNEITELDGRLADVVEKNADLVGELADRESLNDRLSFDLKDAERELDRLSEAITSAIADLRVLGEVPLGQLEESIKAIADRLADKNGERY
jgi:chromosome segregation ATPase